MARKRAPVVIDTPPGFRWGYGTPLRKKSGSDWFGEVSGFYSTEQTPEGYAIQSTVHLGSVQFYPAQALEEDDRVRF